MNLLHLTLFYYMLLFFSPDAAVKYPPTSPTNVSNCITTNTFAKHLDPGVANMILQSKDGGESWQDISQSLPDNAQPEDLFAGESDVYLRANGEIYHSKSNLHFPTWEKEKVLDPRCTSIAFNYSGIMAFNCEGQIYKKMPDVSAWLPAYKSFNKHLVRTIFETFNGTVILGCDNGLYKSDDKGQTWKEVHNYGSMDLVEADGVLIATGQKGIMRSTDNGEHWEWVISEGGVGITVERIDGGFAAIVYSSNTKSRSIRISLDRGKTWKAIDQGLRPALSVTSIKQMGRYLIVGHPDGIFRSSDMGRTWEIVRSSVDFTFRIDDAKVYKLYVSGNVLYAVAKGPGC